jgi:3-dehydroquinate dehydratase
VIKAVEKFKKDTGLYDFDISKDEIIKLVNAALNADSEDFVNSEDYLNSDTATRNLRATNKVNSIDILKNIIASSHSFESTLLGQIAQERDKIQPRFTVPSKLTNSQSNSTVETTGLL